MTDKLQKDLIELQKHYFHAYKLVTRLMDLYLLKDGWTGAQPNIDDIKNITDTIKNGVFNNQSANYFSIFQEQETGRLMLQYDNIDQQIGIIDND